MKVLKVFVKLVFALAAVAGAIYALATYGDKIVAWCKDLVNRISSCNCFCTKEVCCETDFEGETEEAEELNVEEAAIAEETDFEG